MKQAPAGPRYRPPLAAIQMGMSDRSNGETRYGTWLVWFMRALSLMWIVQGLVSWSAVLLANDDGQGAIETMSALGASAVIFFAVLDMVAAVGLWLAAAWGGVVWLVAVAVQWLALIILPRFFAFDLSIGAADLLLVAAYFYLTYQAARESELSR